MPIRPNAITATVSPRQIAMMPRPCLMAQINSRADPAHSSRMVTSQSMLTPRCWNRNWAKVPPTPNSVAAVTAQANPILFTPYYDWPDREGLGRLAEAQGHAVAFANGVVFGMIEF